MRRSVYTIAMITAMGAARIAVAQVREAAPAREAGRGASAREAGRGPLEGQPAVRGRLELREGRFELGPTFGFTVGQPFRHTFLVGLKGEYHLLDWLSAGAMINFGASSFDTTLTSKIDDVSGAELEQCTREEGDARDRCEHTRGILAQEEADWHKALNEAAWTAALRGTLTPFAGKLALFSSVFWSYDFYGFGGLGFVQLKNGSDAELENDGMQVGPHVGIGMHVYFTEAFAASFEFSDTIVKNNPSGRDIDLNPDESDECSADPSVCNRVDAGDARTSGYYVFLIGVTAYLPLDAPRSK
ncbi:MAG: hypothetical protein AABZ30_13935 [Myxococcota bacterium]